MLEKVEPQPCRAWLARQPALAVLGSYSRVVSTTTLSVLCSDLHALGIVERAVRAADSISKGHCMQRQ